MTMPTTNAAHSPALTETRKHHSTSPALYAKQHVITVSCQTACHPSFTPNSMSSQLHAKQHIITTSGNKRLRKQLGNKNITLNGKCSNCYNWSFAQDCSTDLVHVGHANLPCTCTAMWSSVQNVYYYYYWSCTQLFNLQKVTDKAADLDTTRMNRDCCIYAHRQQRPA